MTYDELRAAYVEADARMKKNNGHRFETILKTRCVYCRRRPGVKTKCGGWFQTFLDRLDEVLVERGIVK